MYCNVANAMCGNITGRQAQANDGAAGETFSPQTLKRVGIRATRTAPPPTSVTSHPPTLPEEPMVELAEEDFWGGKADDTSVDETSADDDDGGVSASFGEGSQAQSSSTTASATATATSTTATPAAAAATTAACTAAATTIATTGTGTGTGTLLEREPSSGSLLQELVPSISSAQGSCHRRNEHQVREL